MASPYRVCVPRKDEKTGKTFWTHIGAAFPRQNGGMSVMLDALPIGRELVIFPPDEGKRQAPPSDTNGDDVTY